MLPYLDPLCVFCSRRSFVKRVASQTAEKIPARSKRLAITGIVDVAVTIRSRRIIAADKLYIPHPRCLRLKNRLLKTN